MHAKRIDVDMRYDAWLAGFVDGEGCFLISPKSGAHIMLPRFVIQMHYRDWPLLQRCAAAFGGSVCVRYTSRNPMTAWTVSAKAGLGDLVDYFNRFPLRSAKAADFVVWRAAVDLYLAVEDVSRVYRQMMALSDELATARVGNPPQLQRTRRRPTYDAIAQQAGFSRDTVARALLGSPLVADSTRDHIMAVCAALTADAPLTTVRVVSEGT